MTKQFLQMLRHYDSELRILRTHLREMEASIGISSPNIDGQPRGSRIGKPTEEQAVRIAELIGDVRKLEAQILDARIKTWDYITTIEDPILRQIVILRFVDGRSWFKVAEGIGGEATADGCRMYFNRMFKDDD